MEWEPRKENNSQGIGCNKEKKEIIATYWIYILFFYFMVDRTTYFSSVINFLFIYLLMFFLQESSACGVVFEVFLKYLYTGMDGAEFKEL